MHTFNDDIVPACFPLLPLMSLITNLMSKIPSRKTMTMRIESTVEKNDRLDFRKVQKTTSNFIGIRDVIAYIV